MAFIAGMVVIAGQASAATCPWMNAGQSPGQSEKVTIPLDPMLFAYWNTANNEWMVSAGTYQVMVGSSSSDIAGQGSVALPGKALGG